MDRNQVTPEERKALLVEYQVCQDDNAANFQGFWTLAAIFIGLSSAFLAGLIYAVTANELLFSSLLSHNQPQTLVVGIIALIIGTANVVILKSLEGWHRRVKFNQGTNLERMREIELDLGVMHRAWRIPAIDEWNKIPNDKRKEATRDKKWSILKDKLKDYIKPKYHKQLDSLKKDLLPSIIQYSPERNNEGKDQQQYEPPSSRKHFPRILYTIMSLWVLVISAAVFSIIAAFICWQWGVVAVGIILAAYIIYIYRIIRKCRNTHIDQKTI